MAAYRLAFGMFRGLEKTLALVYFIGKRLHFKGNKIDLKE